MKVIEECLYDTWRIDMNSTIDKRLVVFIPSFISSKQSEKESE